jgi:hypothetical protein
MPGVIVEPRRHVAANQRLNVEKLGFEALRQFQRAKVFEKRAMHETVKRRST